MQQKKGFTLIELLVVIGIIGLLATLAVVAFGSAQQRSRDAKRVADVRAIVSAFAAASQDDVTNAICVGATDLSAAEAMISTVSIKQGPGGCAAGTNVTTNYINLSNVKDPKTPGVVCTFAGNLPNIPCDYTIKMGGAITSFILGFNTENAAATGLSAGLFHSANQNGIVQ